MKHLFKIILILVFTFNFNELRANTLFESLNSAYLNNPKLNAERASMRASKEDKREPHALSVVNDWINRDYCCGFNIWKQISEEIPTKVVGDTPGLSEPAKSVDDLVNQYRSSQVFLNTSTLSPIPMSLLEAMSCGCAVVSTNNCAIPEVIKDGENGFFFDNPAEARQKISMLLSNPELARRIGQNARDTILSNFSEGVFIDKWNDIFRRASNMVYTGVN